MKIQEVVNEGFMDFFRDPRKKAQKQALNKAIQVKKIVKDDLWQKWVSIIAAHGRDPQYQNPASYYKNMNKFCQFQLELDPKNPDVKAAAQFAASQPAIEDHHIRDSFAKYADVWYKLQTTGNLMPPPAQRAKKAAPAAQQAPAQAGGNPPPAAGASPTGNPRPSPAPGGAPAAKTPRSKTAQAAKQPQQASTNQGAVITLMSHGMSKTAAEQMVAKALKAGIPNHAGQIEQFALQNAQQSAKKPRRAPASATP